LVIVQLADCESGFQDVLVEEEDDMDLEVEPVNMDSDYDSQHIHMVVTILFS